MANSSGAILWRANVLEGKSNMVSFVDALSGGVITVINNRLRNITETIYCNERYGIVLVANYFIVTLYLPCVGTSDRLLICENA